MADVTSAVAVSFPNTGPYICHLNPRLANLCNPLLGKSNHLSFFMPKLFFSRIFMVIFSEHSPCFWENLWECEACEVMKPEVTYVTLI